MYYLGIDIGGTKSAVVLGNGSDTSMSIVGKRKFPTLKIMPECFLEQICDEIYLLLGEYSISVIDIIGIGISCGGPLNSSKGIIMSPPNLPFWDNVNIVDFFEQRFNVKTYLQNDANAGAVAEWKYGAGRGCRNVIFLTFGTGLGAGLILDNKLYCGTNDMAGEIGHIRLDVSGPVGYGKVGSMEGFCSGGGISQLACFLVKEQLQQGKNPRLLEAAGGYDNIDAKLIADLANDNDELSKKVYDISAEKLGVGLSILIDILNPEVIIIGSIFTLSQNLLWDKAKQVIDSEALELSRNVCRVVPSMLNGEVGDYAALSVATGKF